MFFKYAIFFCVVLLFVDTETSSIAERDTNSSTQSSLNIEALKKNMEQFKSCIDQSLTNVVGEMNEKQLKPLFNVIGDHLNRFSRAFAEITAPNADSATD